MYIIMLVNFIIALRNCKTMSYIVVLSPAIASRNHNMPKSSFLIGLHLSIVHRWISLALLCAGVTLTG